MMDAAKITELEQRLQRLESLLSKTDTTVRDQVASVQAKAPTVLPTMVHTDRVQEAAWMIRVRATGFAIGEDDDGKAQIQVTPKWEIYSPVALINNAEVVAQNCTKNQWNDITSTIGDAPGGKSLYGVVIQGDDGITGVQLVMSKDAPQTQHVTIATFNTTGVSAYAQAHTGVLVLTAPGSSGGGASGDTYVPDVYEGSTEDTAKMKAVHVKFTSRSGAVKDFSSINIRGAVFVPDRVVKGDRYGDLDPDTYYLYFKNSQTGAELGPIAIGKLDGADGKDGNDGVSVSSVTTQDVAATSGTPAGTKVTITLSNGTSKTFTIYNGTDGTNGVEKELTVVTGVSYNKSTHKFTMDKCTIKGYFTTISTEPNVEVFTATAHSGEHQ